MCAFADAMVPWQDQGYNCPVYKVKKRTDLNFVFSCKVRCEEQPMKWTLRGVALLCSTD